MAGPATAPPENAPGPKNWGRPARRWLGAILAIGLVVGWEARQPEGPIGEDAATYLVLSRSLAQGQYRDEFLWGTPPDAKYPPGMPVFLYAVHATLGDDPDVPRAINLLMLAAIALLAGDAVRRIASPTLGVAVAAAVMFSPGLVHHAGTILSETLYTFLSMLAIWGMLRLRQEPRPLRWVVLVTVTAVLAALTRSIGVVCLAAVLVGLILRHRSRTGLAIAAVGIGAVLLWFAYTRQAAGQGTARNYGGELAYSVSVATSGGAVRHALELARTYLVWVPGTQMGMPNIPGVPWENLAWAALLIAGCLIGILLMLRSWTTAVIYACFYAGVVLLWPFPDGRLAVPVLPIVTVMFALGSAAAVRRAFPGARPWASLAPTAALAAIGLLASGRSALALTRCRGGAQYLDVRCFSVESRDYRTAAEFVRQNLADGTVIVTSRPALMYVMSGHQTLPWEQLYREDIDSILVPKGPIRHVLLPLRSREDSTSLYPSALRARCTASAVLRPFGESSALLDLQAASPDSAAACSLLDPQSPM